VAKSSDRIKIVEAELSGSLPNFAVTKASI